MEESSYESKWCDEGTSNLSLMSLRSTGSGSCGSALSSDGNNRGRDRFHLMDFKVRTLHHVSVSE